MSKGTYSYSNRHRMHEKEFPFKEGDYVSFNAEHNFVGHGEIFKVCDDEYVIVQTGNGGRGLEYVKKKDIRK